MDEVVNVNVGVTVGAVAKKLCVYFDAILYEPVDCSDAVKLPDCTVIVGFVLVDGAITLLPLVNVHR